MEKIYDLIIIGSGPAGLTASIYAGRAKLDAIVIEKNSMSGGQIINTYDIDNYPGIPGISGFELANRFREHAEKAGASFIEGSVESFYEEKDIKVVSLTDGQIYKSKTIIIACGAEYKKLGVPGEEELKGRGVSYCATCDGAFFRNKQVVVVGGGNVAVEDAIFLARICKKVMIVHRRNQFRAAKELVSKLVNLENIEIIWDSVVEQIIGEQIVTEVIIKDIKNGKFRNILVNGVFIAVGTEPVSSIYKEKIETDKNGYILAGENCETSMAGVLAAGDVRQKELKQVITAAADGANAITAVERYLNKV